MGARDTYIREGFTDYLSKPVVFAELEGLLLKYIDSSLIVTDEQPESPAAASSGRSEEKSPEENKPVVLVISGSPEKLKDLKDLFADRYKGVFVRDEASAENYLKKHHADFIMRDGEDHPGL